MYLTAGLFKGRKIIVPDNVKPTLSKVRQGVFNMLSTFEFQNMTFLDMFSGSGLMGLEAISRGYKVRELEINKNNAKIIKQNYKNLDLKADIIIVNSLSYITNDKFDVVYLDPPWDYNYEPVIKKALSLKNDNGVIVIEYDNQKNIDIEEIINKNKFNLEQLKLKKYGRCRISILR